VGISRDAMDARGSTLFLIWPLPFSSIEYLNPSNLQGKHEQEEENTYSDEDEAVSSDLDMHSLILGRTHESEPEPPTAEEVIREIDYMMQVSEVSKITYGRLLY